MKAIAPPWSAMSSASITRRTGASSTAGNVLRSASCRAMTRRKRPQEGVAIQVGGIRPAPAI